MFFSRILVCLTFILMTCTSLGLAQRSEPAANFSVGGQIVLSVSGLKEPVLVLLDHSGSKNDQRTFTDLRGNFEFRNVPQGPYNIRLRLEGFEHVNYPVDIPETPYVFEAAELMLLHVYVRQGRLSAALRRMDALLQKNPGNSRNPALEKFRSEVVTALAKLKQGAEKQK